MKSGNATGAQVAFFTFALLLLIVPVSSFVQGLHPWTPEESALIRRALPFLVLAPLLAVIPGIRRICRAELARPIPPRRRAEVLVVGVLSLAKGFAWAGLWVLWWWLLEGAWSVEQRIHMLDSHDSQMASASTAAEWARSIVLAGFVGPVIEELVFRRFLYRAWEKQLGWIASMLLTSALFGFYHPNFVPAFLASILYVCLYRRTGTLWAPIAVHAFFNIAAFYPFLGQFTFQVASNPSGDISSWGFHMACLLFVAIALPTYAWMSRSAIAAQTPPLASDEPVPG